MASRSEALSNYSVRQGSERTSWAGLVDGFAVAALLGAELVQGALYPNPQNGTGAFAGAKGARRQIIGNSAGFPAAIGADEQIGCLPSTDIAHRRLAPSSGKAVPNHAASRILGKILTTVP